MKIAINAQLLSGPRFGIWTYIYNLIKQLSLVDRENYYSIFANSNAPDVSGNTNFHVKKSILDASKPPLRILWEQGLMWLDADIRKADIFHNPDHTLPFAPVKAKKIITVHDLAFYKHPETFPFLKRTYKRAITPGALRRADRIIADSGSTKQDIVDLFRLPAEKISVVHIGVGEEFSPVKDEQRLSSVREKYGLSKGFILFVGTLEKRKNIDGLLDAYIKAAGESSVPQDLVIAGRKGWLYEGLFEKARKAGLGERVKFLHGVTQQELPVLYSLADLFVYPSIYEGFGLPVLEAMACGTPVITSNVSSLPEVAGDAGIMVDPKDTDALAESILKVLSDKALSNSLRAKGLERAKLFSWENCARKTLQVYKEALVV